MHQPQQTPGGKGVLCRQRTMLDQLLRLDKSFVATPPNTIAVSLPQLPGLPTNSEQQTHGQMQLQCH